LIHGLRLCECYGGEEWEASRGPQIASQKVVIIEAVDELDVSFKGKWMNVSRVLVALV